MAGLFRRPVETAGRTPGGSRARFPGFDVLGQVGSWDAATAGVVLARLTAPPSVRFFDLAEEAVGRALFDQLLDQREEPRVPVFELVDSRLAEFETDGWHYADLPEDGEAFRRSFAAIDEDSREAFGDRFAALEWGDQAAVVEAVRKTNGDWHEMPADQIWSLWTRYACTAFYGHPWAWNEIGFGGPAYPRGYKNLGVNSREPWEVADHDNTDPARDRPT
jgi:hypothetical protein